MVAGNGLRAGQVRDGPSHFQDAVIGPGSGLHVGHRLFEEFARRLAKLAERLQLPCAHARVAGDFRFAGTRPPGKTPRKTRHSKGKARRLGHRLKAPPPPAARRDLLLPIRHPKMADQNPPHFGTFCRTVLPIPLHASALRAESHPVLSPNPPLQAPERYNSSREHIRRKGSRNKNETRGDQSAALNSERNHAMNEIITPVGPKQVRRTIDDPTPRTVQAHTQPPVGNVICAFCHKPTNLDAAGLFASFGTQVPIEAINYYQPELVIPMGHWVVCPNCTGPLGISKRGNIIHVGFGNLPDSVPNAEKILAKKAAQANSVSRF